MSEFLLGLFVGLFVAWMLWEGWSFDWTNNLGLRVDLFTLSREEVLDEFCWAVRDKADVVASRAAMSTTDKEKQG